MNFVEATKEKLNLLRAGICLLVLVIAAVSWAGYRTVRDFRGSISLVTQTYTVLDNIEATLDLVEEAETATRDYVLTQNYEHLEPYQRRAESLQEYLERLRVSTADDAWQQAHVAELVRLTRRLDELGKSAVAERSKSLAAAVKVIKADEAKLARLQIRDLMAEMKEHERVLLGLRQRTAGKRMSGNTVWCAVLLLADIGFLAWVSILTFKLNRLQRVIRVCAWTKKIELEGRWVTMEEYLQKNFNAPVTHGICAEAAASMIAEVNQQSS